MLTWSLVPSTRAILHRAFLSTSRPAPSPPPAPAHPTSTRTTQDALYADQGPSAAAENATQPASFPYGQPLASSSSSTPPPPPPPTPVTTAATTEQAPSQLPLGLEPEQSIQEAPVSRSRRPVGAFRGGSVPRSPTTLLESFPQNELTFASPPQDHRLPSRIDRSRRLRLPPRPRRLPPSVRKTPHQRRRTQNQHRTGPVLLSLLFPPPPPPQYCVRQLIPTAVRR